MSLFRQRATVPSALITPTASPSTGCVMTRGRAVASESRAFSSIVYPLAQVPADVRTSAELECETFRSAARFHPPALPDGGGEIGHRRIFSSSQPHTLHVPEEGAQPNGCAPCQGQAETTTLTVRACGPFGPSSTSYSTFAPSARLLYPSPLIALWWTKTSLPRRPV